MGLLDEQLSVLQIEYAGAEKHPLPDGSHVITVPGISLPEGWSTSNTTAKFLVLAAYPHAKPDCFWVDPSLRLKSGAQPQNTNTQQIPGTSHTWLWFSWHATQWNPNRDTLTTYVNVIRERLKRPQ